MIKFVEGDFFDFDADIRVNTVNCVGVMGAGVALTFKKKFPDMYNDYVQSCLEDKVRPGVPHVWKDIKMFSELTIINFPTKNHWKNPSEYIYIEKGLIWLKNYLTNNNCNRITIPALGCGHGGLNWNIVKKMIFDHLHDINCEIFVFEPSSSTNNKFLYDTEDLSNNHIYKLLPSNNLYPNKIKGRSSIEIFYKGNINLTSKKNISIIVNSNPDQREVNALNLIIDNFPNDDFVFLLGFNSKYEIDLAKKIFSKGFKAILVIPYGICQLKIRKDLVNIITEENSVFFSITSPNQTWKSYESINSLKFRFKIADILLINSLHFEKFKNFENDIVTNDNKKFYLNYWNNQIDFFTRISANKIGIDPITKRPNTHNILNSLNHV